MLLTGVIYACLLRNKSQCVLLASKCAKDRNLVFLLPPLVAIFFFLQMERESIILDNLQEELPENPKEKERASKEELEEFLECTNIYGESVNAEKRLLRLILQRVRSILMVPECPSAEGGSLPVMNEIQTMQNRTKE